MRASVPHMERVPDPFGIQKPTEVPVVVQKRILGTDGKNDIHTLQPLQPCMTAKLAQEVTGGVEIDILIVVAVEQVSKMLHRKRQVVSPRKSAHLLEKVRVAKRDVYGVKCAEATPVCNRAGVRVFRGHKRQHFPQNVFFKLDVATDPAPRQYRCHQRSGTMSDFILELSLLLLQLGEVFGRIRVKLLHAGLAAEFDLPAFVRFDYDLAHAAELVATDDAGVERVRIISGKASGGEDDEGGGEQSFHEVLCGWVWVCEAFNAVGRQNRKRTPAPRPKSLW